jgi:hypothetical protein
MARLVINLNTNEKGVWSMKFFKTVLLIGLVLLSFAGDIQAQEFCRGSCPRTRYASTQPYEGDIWQARIRAAAAETLLLYRLAERRYLRISSRLSLIASDPGQSKVVRAGGRYELAFERLEIGAPGLTEVATAHIESLQSIIRRANAGQMFNVREAVHYVQTAQMDLLHLNIYLTQLERQVRSLDFQTWTQTPNGREPYIRISPNQPPYRHP